LKGAIQKISGFTIGVIGGLTALIISIVLEIILSVPAKSLLDPGSGFFFLLILLIPAFLEEITKIAIAKKIRKRIDTLWVIGGVGVGFGLMETLVAAGGPFLESGRAPLPLLHPFFLLAGFAAAKYVPLKKDKWFYLKWILASGLLHWGYNIAQATFLLKP